MTDDEPEALLNLASKKKLTRLYLAVFAHSEEIDAGVERENGVFDAEDSSKALESAQSFANTYLLPLAGTWRVAELIEVESEAHALDYLKHGRTTAPAPDPAGFDATETVTMDFYAVFRREATLSMGD